MHSKCSHTLLSSLITGCLLFLLSACSFLSTNTAAPALQTTALTSPTATPTPRISDTALLTYTGHSQTVLSLAWSPDGKYIASGSNDRTVQVWDTRTGKRILTYRGHKTGVT